MRMFLTIAAGAALGYGFYLLVGCGTGSCLFFSNPYIAAFIGGLVSLSMSDGKKIT
jgi:hypothetical protein